MAPPTLPPAKEPVADEVVKPRSAAAVSASTNPFSTTPVGGDRYAPLPKAEAAPVPASNEVELNADAAAAPADAAKSDAPPAAAPAAPSEVARGQEPSDVNPLRTASNRSASGETNDAKSAFANDAQASTPATLDLGAKLQAKNDGANNASGAGPSTRAAGAGRYDFSAAPQTAPRASGEVAAGTPAANEPQLPTPARDAATGNLRDMERAPLEPRIASSAPNAAPLRGGAVGLSAAPALADDEALGGDAGITPTPGLAAVDGQGRPGERQLEGLQTPTITVQKLAPAEIQVGKKCTFAVRVVNSSQRTAHNVQVRDEVPLGTQLLGAAPKASVSGTQVVWDIGTLSAGEERIVEMELMPTDEGELGSIATVTFAAQASAKTRCTRPELALRLTTGPRVMVGQQHIVEIEVSNPGTGDATGVMLLESVPDGVSHEAGPALEYPIGTLRAGDSRRLEIVLTAEHAGKISNVMTARADASLQVEAACEFEVIAPDLEVTVEGPQKRYLERPATYTVSVNNPGTAAAKEVQLVTKLPKGLQFVSANNMGEYDAATHSVYWSLAELPPKEQGAVELTALPVEPGEHKLEVATRALQGLEDSTEAHVTVEGLVALSFEVAAADGAIEVGGETTYEITVVNQGSKPAANVQVVAVTPQGIRPTSGQGETRHQVQGDRVVFAPVPQLAPKAEAKFRVKVQGLQAGDQRTRIQVTTDEVREPITKELSTQVYADQ
jgi:uncharacterized repeat protein (TIGR01451 family)